MPNQKDKTVFVSNKQHIGFYQTLVAKMECEVQIKTELRLVNTMKHTLKTQMLIWFKSEFEKPKQNFTTKEKKSKYYMT